MMGVWSVVSMYQRRGEDDMKLRRNTDKDGMNVCALHPSMRCMCRLATKLSHFGPVGPEKSLKSNIDVM